MIYPKHYLFFPLLFRIYTQYLIKRHFENHIIVPLNDLKSDKPLLAICNHFSWWDGFWVLSLNSKLWQKKFHVLMNKDNLIKNKWLNYTGAFSMDKHAIRSSLDECGRVLTDPESILLIFPQGKFQSIYTKHLIFKRGVSYIISQRKNAFDIVLIANFVEYNSAKKPILTSYCQRIGKEDCTGSLEELYNYFYNKSMNHHISHTQA